MKRPAGVIVIAIFVIISSVIGIFAGLRGLGVPLPSIGGLVLNPGTPMFLMVPVISATVLVLSLIELVLAVGLLLLKSWAWTGAVTVAAIRIFTDLFFFLTGGFGLIGQGIMLGVYVGAGGALINLIIIIYLLRGRVKEAFGK